MVTSIELYSIFLTLVLLSGLGSAKNYTKIGYKAYFPTDTTTLWQVFALSIRSL